MLVAVGIAWPNRLAVLVVAVYLCLVVCDRRALLIGGIRTDTLVKLGVDGWKHQF